MWRFFLVASLILGSLLTITAQSASGLYNGKYAGINGVLLNPASARSFPYEWELNLTSFNAFGHTDYLFVKETNLFHLLKNLNSFARLPKEQNAPLDPALLYYDFPLEAFSNTSSFIIELNGPGFLYNFENFSIGVFSRLRANGGSHSIPASLSYFGIQNSFRDTEVISGSASASSLLWSEYGVSFSSDQFIDKEGLSIGINVKYVNSHHGGYVKSFDDFSYNRTTEDSLVLFQPQFEFGITSTTADDQSFSIPANGNGISIDLGVSYDTPIGIANFSILDIGFAKVKNSEVYNLQSTQDIVLNTDDIQNAPSIRAQIEEIDDQVSQQLDRRTTILSNNEFKIGLPTRIHFDFTYNLSKGRSVLMSFDQRIPVFSNSLEAENAIVIAPRYEDKWWMITTPITVYEYSKVRIGLAARLAFLNIGTDHLASLIGKSDFRGSSVYAGIKFHPFWQTDAHGNNRARKGTDVMCPLPN